jgi:CheY-like chemotaxis protein
MPIKVNHRSKPLPDARLPASSRILHPPLEGCPAQPAERLNIDTGCNRFLVVDDDPVTLELVSKMVIALGYQATTAPDAIDALYFLDKSHFNVVISDYDMPLMDGFQLASRIKKKHPTTRVIIMTGHSEEFIANILGGSDVVDGLLLKPFSLETMQAKVERVAGPLPGKWAS